MPKLLDGTAAQSGHVRNNGDYNHDRINFPVLGVVLNLHPSDDFHKNKSAIAKQDGRGSRWEAEVLVLNDGTDTYMTLPNVVILPRGPSGIDDFSEDLPKPCSQMIDGSRFKANMASIDPYKLDGDFVIVQFIGGKITQPVITNWYPHPSNFTDPSTQGIKQGTLVQGKRSLKRYNGVELTVTPAGSVHLDTNNSGSTVVGTDKGPSRKSNVRGGDVMVNVKPGRTCEVNFNPTVPNPTGEPSLPQPNPPAQPNARQDTNTALTMDKDFINAVAGQVVQLVGKIVADGILLGEEPTDHVIKGETHQATYNAFVSVFNALVETYAAHTHPTPNGQSGRPLPDGVPPVPNPWVATVLSPYFGMAYVTDEAVISASLSTPYPLPSQPVAAAPATSSEMPSTDLSEVVKIQ